MSSRARVALIAPFAAALASLALAETEPPMQTRATIRGTGNDITIVYRGVKDPARRADSAPADAVAEATRLAAAGADDASLIAYLRTHQSELPAIVDADAVRGLRKAGAGPAVITDLSRMTALDIGATGEGSPVAYASESASEGYGSYPSAEMGYPFYGSGFYGGYGFSGSGHRLHHGGHFKPGHSMRPGRPGGPSRPPAPSPSRSVRAGVARFPRN
jgi:hypothetical protein